MPAHLPRLVAVTGYGLDRDRVRTREAGFQEHLVKPAEFTAIAAILHRLETETAPAPAPGCVLDAFGGGSVGRFADAAAAPTREPGRQQSPA